MIDRKSIDPYHTERIVQGRCQILSFDGGGIKGLFSAAVLAHWESDLKVKASDHFDLYAGTSTGGLIALGIANEMKAHDIVDFYEEQGPKIFPPSGFTIFNKHFNYRGWLTRKYSREPLKAALKQIYSKDKKIGDLRRRVLITSYDLGNSKVHTLKTPHHPRLKRDHKYELWKVALATSAAPSYFPAATEIDNLRLIDGGVWANNPAHLAALEANSMLGVPYEDIHVLSIGTTNPLKARPEHLNWGGKLLWASSASDVIMQAQSRAAIGQLQHLIPRENVKRIDLDVPEGRFSLDRANYKELTAMASSISRDLCPEVQYFFRHQPETYEPFNKGEIHA